MVRVAAGGSLWQRVSGTARRAHTGAAVALAAVCVAACWSPRPAHAAGYAIWEQGPRVLGMGGAGAAAVDDPSALFYNPAAIVRLQGTQVMAGATMLSPRTSFAGMNPYPGYGVTEQMENANFFPPMAFVTHARGRWGVGASLTTPYGLGVRWRDPDTFTGRAIVTRADLSTLDLGLTAAWAFTPAVSVAAGPDVVWAKVNLQNRVQVPVPGGGGATVDVARAELASDYTPAPGWHAAVSWLPAPIWKLGLSYRARVVTHVDDGRATFRQIPTGDAGFDAAVAASLPPDQKATSVLRFPATWSAGIAWSPRLMWTLEGDVDFVEWSAFRDLPIRLEQTPAESRTLQENYRDTWQVRAGVERRAGTWTARAGAYVDEAAAPTASVSPILPDARRTGLTGGLGWNRGRWSADAYDLALFLARRGTGGVNRDGYEGEYKTFVNAAGLGVTLRF